MSRSGVTLPHQFKWTKKFENVLLISLVLFFFHDLEENSAMQDLLVVFLIPALLGSCLAWDPAVAILFNSSAAFISDNNTESPNSSAPVRIPAFEQFQLTKLKPDSALHRRIMELVLDITEGGLEESATDAKGNRLRTRLQSAVGGGKLFRLEQIYRGVKVYGAEVIVRLFDGQTREIKKKNETEAVVFVETEAETRLRGKFMEPLESIPGLIPSDFFDVVSVLRRLTSRFSPRFQISDEQVELIIYVDGEQNGRGLLAFKIEFFAENLSEGLLLQPNFIVDAESGQIIRFWNGLRTAIPSEFKPFPIQL